MYDNEYMGIGVPKDITEIRRFFAEPSHPRQRQYEALRAFFVEKVPSKEAAQRFGYSARSFRVLVHQFRQNPSRPFFLPPAKGPQKAPKSDPLREQIVRARKQNLSIYDIQRILHEQGQPLSSTYISLILKEEGFARLPRRADEERPDHPHPDKAPVADVQQLDLSPG